MKRQNKNPKAIQKIINLAMSKSSLNIEIAKRLVKSQRIKPSQMLMQMMDTTDFIQRHVMDGHYDLKGKYHKRKVKALEFTKSSTNGKFWLIISKKYTKINHPPNMVQSIGGPKDAEQITWHPHFRAIFHISSLGHKLREGGKARMGYTQSDVVVGDNLYELVFALLTNETFELPKDIANPNLNDPK